MVHREKIKYYIMNETTVDPDIAMKHRQVLHENVVDTPNGKLYTITFKQCLQSFGTKNWNGRNYSKQIVLDSLARNPIVQNDIKEDTWCGEYGHPIIEKGMNELARQMTIFPPYACWRISKYWDEGNLLFGTTTTLSGGYGDMVRDRILTNFPAMASSRAIGGVDRNGNVLPGYMVQYFDCVIRPSHKEAYMQKGSEQINTFGAPGQGNSMTESAIQFDPNFNDPGLANFLLSESSSRQQINMLCDTLKLDYDSMVLTENSMKISRIDGLDKTTVIIPIRSLVNAEYYNLF